MNFTMIICISFFGQGFASNTYKHVGISSLNSFDLIDVWTQVQECLKLTITSTHISPSKALCGLLCDSEQDCDCFFVKVLAVKFSSL